MSDSRTDKLPETQPESAGGPPRPPKRTARDLADDSPDEPHIDIPHPVVVRDLAAFLRQKPFVIVADLMELGAFVYPDESVAFDIASKVARMHGFYTRRVV